jgi:hypothetical protein
VEGVAGTWKDRSSVMRIRYSFSLSSADVNVSSSVMAFMLPYRKQLAVDDVADLDPVAGLPGGSGDPAATTARV